MSNQKAGAKWYTLDKMKYRNRVFAIESLPDNRLYSQGTYPTKLSEDNLPSSFVGVWLHGKEFIDTAGIIDVRYCPNYYSDNHLYKDDFLYISWTSKLKAKRSRYSMTRYENYDKIIWGNAIETFVDKAIEMNDGEIKKRLLSIKRALAQKLIWFCHINPDRCKTVGDERSIVIPVTYIIRPMDNFKRPASEAEQREVMDAFCEKNGCKKIGEARVVCEKDAEAIGRTLKHLKVDEPIRPVFLYVVTQQFQDPNEDSLERSLFKAIHKDQATLCSVFLRKNASVKPETDG